MVLGSSSSPTWRDPREKTTTGSVTWMESQGACNSWNPFQSSPSHSLGVLSLWEEASHITSRKIHTTLFSIWNGRHDVQCWRLPLYHRNRNYYGYTCDVRSILYLYSYIPWNCQSISLPWPFSRSSLLITNSSHSIYAHIYMSLYITVYTHIYTS